MRVDELFLTLTIFGEIEVDRLWAFRVVVPPLPIPAGILVSACLGFWAKGFALETDSVLQNKVWVD